MVLSLQDFHAPSQQPQHHDRQAKTVIFGGQNTAPAPAALPQSLLPLPSTLNLYVLGPQGPFPLCTTQFCNAVPNHDLPVIVWPSISCTYNAMLPPRQRSLALEEHLHLLVPHQCHSNKMASDPFRIQSYSSSAFQNTKAIDTRSTQQCYSDTVPRPTAILLHTIISPYIGEKVTPQGVPHYLPFTKNLHNTTPTHTHSHQDLPSVYLYLDSSQATNCQGPLSYSLRVTLPTLPYSSLLQTLCSLANFHIALSFPQPRILNTIDSLILPSRTGTVTTNNIL